MVHHGWYMESYWFPSTLMILLSLIPLFSSRIALHSIKYALESYWINSSLMIFLWMHINFINSFVSSLITLHSIDCFLIKSHCIQLNMLICPLITFNAYQCHWFPFFQQNCIQFNMNWIPIDSILPWWYIPLNDYQCHWFVFFLIK